MATDPRAGKLLKTWFGDSRESAKAASERQSFWFAPNADDDALLQREFGPMAAQAAAGALDGWGSEPRGRLALILLLDQLPRNLHRGTAQAYAQDPAALRWCVSGIGRGLDDPLAPIERAFFYMPLEHAEDIGIQEKSVEAFSELAEQYPGWPVFAEGFLPYAIKHRDIIARFGRFPHRNEVLGRTSTPEEAAYLENADSFGQ